MKRLKYLVALILGLLALIGSAYAQTRVQIEGTSLVVTFPDEFHVGVDGGQVDDMLVRTYGSEEAFMQHLKEANTFLHAVGTNCESEIMISLQEYSPSIQDLGDSALAATVTGICKYAESGGMTECTGTYGNVNGINYVIIEGKMLQNGITGYLTEFLTTNNGKMVLMVLVTYSEEMNEKWEPFFNKVINSVSLVSTEVSQEVQVITDEATGVQFSVPIQWEKETVDMGVDFCRKTVFTIDSENYASTIFTVIDLREAVPEATLNWEYVDGDMLPVEAFANCLDKTPEEIWKERYGDVLYCMAKTKGDLSVEGWKIQYPMLSAMFIRNGYLITFQLITMEEGAYLDEFHAILENVQI